jgi:bifunctional DNase/RNase
LTHDLLKTIINELDGSVSHIFVNNIHDNTFYARIVIEQEGRTFEIDSRPSDAIALAVRLDAPIYVEPHVLDQAGVFFDEEEQQSTTLPEPSKDDPEIEMSDDSLSLFRDFIDTLDTDNTD